MKQAEVVRSVETKVDGDARVLKSVIELDKARADSSPGAKEMIEKKEATLADMQEKSLDLTSQISGKISDVVEKTNGINEPQGIVPSEESKEDVCGRCPHPASE